MSTSGTSRGNTLLIQFAKAPVPGEVKTRLLPVLSPESAAALHAELVLWVSRMLCGSGIGPVQLAVSGSSACPLFDACRREGVASILTQHGDDLGARMHHALQRGLQAYSKVLLVGSDCPAMDAAYLKSAAAALDEHPVVLGAAVDGGYVLVGATQIEPSVFTGVHWGSAAVLAQTLANVERAGLGCAVLDALSDIDRPEDLAHWQALQAASGRYLHP